MGRMRLRITGVKTEDKCLDEDTSLKWYIIKINRRCIVDDQTCFRVWQAMTHFVENDTLIGCHDGTRGLERILLAINLEATVVKCLASRQGEWMSARVCQCIHKGTSASA